jgi:hypothetical protein
MSSLPESAFSPNCVSVYYWVELAAFPSEAIFGLGFVYRWPLFHL